MNKVFVYGTLRKHERNHHFLKHSTLLVEQAWTYGKMFDTGCGYPAIVDDSNKKVYGELYEVSDDDLRQLDWLEDYEEHRDNNLYDRKIVTIYTDNAQEEAIVYVAHQLNMCKEEIALGDWRVYQFLKEKPTSFYYFAYGSCMDQERFRLAKVDHLFSVKYGTGILKNHELRYTKQVHDGGRADIVETKESTVEGIVYQCPFETVEYLFHREGVHNGMYRPAIVEVEINQSVIQPVLTFIVVDKVEEIAPPLHYATEIIRGSKGYVSEMYHQKLQKQLAKLGVKL